jgi:ubiquitin C-terminal hydrolase
MKIYSRFIVFFISFIIFSNNIVLAWRGAGLINGAYKGETLGTEEQYYGQRCYFNSVLQILSKIEEINSQVVAFVDGLELVRPIRKRGGRRGRRGHGSERPVNTISEERVNFLKRYKKLISNPEGSLRTGGRCIDAWPSYKAAISAFFPHDYDLPRQQDAEEFLTGFLDVLSELRNADETLFSVGDGFHFSCNRAGCPGYDENLVPASMIRVNIPDHATHGVVRLEDCLRDYFSDEAVDVDSACRVIGCSGIRINKKRCIFSSGKYLFVQLRRFAWETVIEAGKEISREAKISRAVRCPMVLDLAPYYVDVDEAVGNENYELFGFIIHSGGCDAGHYWAYVKDSEGSAEPWTCYNDTSVKEKTSGTVRAIANSGVESDGQIYVAVYKKVNDVDLAEASDDIDSQPEAKRRKLDDKAGQGKKKREFGCVMV